jgi:hypothetical protein
MPESVSVRIESVLAAEATQRFAALPATEAGRRELPARHRKQADRRGWQFPGLSVAATRLVAAAGALAIVAGGGYELASRTGTTTTASPSVGSQAAPMQPMSVGPEITYGGPSAQRAIQSVQQSTDFVPAHLTSQASAAVRAAQARGDTSTALPSFGMPGASQAQSSTASGFAAPDSGTAGRLSGCINDIAPGRTLLLVDLAHFEGKPATIIVAAPMAASPAEVWVVGSACSAIDRDVLAQARLADL